MRSVVGATEKLFTTYFAGSNYLHPVVQARFVVWVYCPVGLPDGSIQDYLMATTRKKAPRRKSKKPSAVLSFAAPVPKSDAVSTPTPSADEAQCPDWLDPTSQEAWDEYAPQLRRHGLLAQHNELLFASLCIVVSELQWCQTQTSRESVSTVGAPKLSAVMKHRIFLVDKLVKLCATLGMTPRSFVRLTGRSPLPPGRSKLEPNAERPAVTSRKGRPL